MSRQSINSIVNMLQETKENTPVEQLFLLDLENAIEKIALRKSQKGKASKCYKPSSMNCKRMMAYHRIGIESDDTRRSAQLIGMGESGTDRHERLQEVITKMQEMGYDIEWIDVETYIKENNLKHLEVVSKHGNETKVYYKPLHIRFLTDGIIKYRGEYYILEIKTEVSFKHDVRKDVAEEHKNQITIYSLAFGINKVMVLYENRNLLNKKNFLYEVSVEEQNKAIERLTEVESIVQSGSIPEKEEDKKTCRYCDFAKRCKEDG